MNAVVTARQSQLPSDASETYRPDNYPGVAGLAVFRRVVRMLLDSPAAGDAESRETLLRIITIAQEPDYYIDELLSLCSGHASIDRLNLAIDVLSRTGELVRAYAWAYLRRDIQQSERAYEPNDDYWYILLRSVARAKGDDSFKFLIIKMCSQAATRGMREAVVDALRDLATESAKALLAELAANDEDEFIRAAARDALDDLRGN